MIILDKCNGSCIAINHLSMKKCIPSKTKDLNVKVFNMITKRTEAKNFVKHISCDCKCKFNSSTCSSNNGKWNCEREIYCACKKDVVGMLTHVLVRTVGFFKKIKLRMMKF